MKKIIVLLYVLILTSCLTTEDLKTFCEFSYMQGQIDAMHGDIRIEYSEENEWYWIESPWEDIDYTMYNTYNEYVNIINQAYEEN